MAYGGVVLPPGARSVRIIAFVQGGLDILAGLLFAVGGSSLTSPSGLPPNAGGILIGLGVLLLVVGGLLIWGGVLLGRLSRPARVAVLVYEWLAVAIGLIGLTQPSLGIVSLLLAAIAVYYLQFDSQTKAAFAAAPRQLH